MSWFSARTVVEEPEVSAEVDRFAKQDARFEEAYEGVKWLLSRRCYKVESLKKIVRGVEYNLYCSGERYKISRPPQLLGISEQLRLRPTHPLGRCCAGAL